MATGHEHHVTAPSFCAKWAMMHRIAGATKIHSFFSHLFFSFFKACVYEHDWVLPFFLDSTLTHLDFVFKDRDVDWFPVRNSLAYLSQHRWWWWWQITQKYWCTVSIYIYSIHIQCNTYIWSNYSDVTGPHPKWWFSKGKSLFQGNLGWWNIIIWPDI